MFELASAHTPGVLSLLWLHLPLCFVRKRSRASSTRAIKLAASTRAAWLPMAGTSQGHVRSRSGVDADAAGGAPLNKGCMLHLDVAAERVSVIGSMSARRWTCSTVQQ